MFRSGLVGLGRSGSRRLGDTFIPIDEDENDRAKPVREKGIDGFYYKIATRRPGTFPRDCLDGRMRDGAEVASKDVGPRAWATL